MTSNNRSQFQLLHRQLEQLERESVSLRKIEKSKTTFVYVACLLSSIAGSVIAFTSLSKDFDQIVMKYLTENGTFVSIVVGTMGGLITSFGLGLFHHSRSNKELEVIRTLDKKLEQIRGIEIELNKSLEKQRHDAKS